VPYGRATTTPQQSRLGGTLPGYVNPGLATSHTRPHASQFRHVAPASPPRTSRQCRAVAVGKADLGAGDPLPGDAVRAIVQGERPAAVRGVSIGWRGRGGRQRPPLRGAAHRRHYRTDRRTAAITLPRNASSTIRLASTTIPGGSSRWDGGAMPAVNLQPARAESVFRRDVFSRGGEWCRAADPPCVSHGAAERGCSRTPTAGVGGPDHEVGYGCRSGAQRCLECTRQPAGGGSRGRRSWVLRDRQTLREVHTRSLCRT